MQKSRKALAALLAVMVLCAFLSSVLFIIHEADHNCEGSYRCCQLINAVL
jgi:hypothetical protein